MAQPTEIGDLIQLVVTYTPPAHDPTGKVTAAEMLVLSPSGVETTVTGVEESENVWLFIAADRIDEAGRWTVRVNANAGLIDSLELPLRIARSPFDEPLGP